MKDIATIVSDRFPGELQRLIFEIAARADEKSALLLVLVARHVQTWIEPVLYECIIVRNHRAANLLMETIQSKPKGFLATHVKSVALGESVTFQQSKAILAECSQHITNFAVWCTDRNPSVFLPFVRSPSIRRLSLKSQHRSELTIPFSVLSSLTHLTILDGPYTWFHLRQVARQVKSSDPDEPEYTNATALFRSLTHFGVCSQNWGSMQAILKVAKNLRYFAVIIPPQFKAASVIAHRIAELGDRRVVLVEYSQSMENWEASVRGAHGMWECVERLVEGGYFAEKGEPRVWSDIPSTVDGG